MEKESIKYRPDIDGLRAMAVLFVVGFHAFPKALPGGFIGVDIFFVISGFLISSILYSAFTAPSKRGVSIIATFYGRRIRRIFPSLIVVLSACYVFGFLTLVPGAFKILSLHVSASAAFCLNFILSASTGYFDSVSANMPLLHIWSLGVEEQFYLIWPVIIWIAVQLRINLLRTAVFVAACSFFLNEYKIGSSIEGAFFLPQMRFWELSIGSITAALFPSVQAILAQKEGVGAKVPSVDTGKTETVGATALANLLGFAGISLISLGLFVITTASDVPDKKSLLPTLGAALIIFAGRSAWINRKFLSLGPLVGVGLISYPLYLWHWPLLSFTSIFFADAWSSTGKLIAIAVSALLAYLTYELIERPIRNGRKNALKTSSLLTAMILVGVVGYATYRNNGFPNRFPPIIRELTNYSYEYGKYWREGTYFLDTDQNESSFKNDLDEIKPDRPTIYLWGDSHAAALYPGLKASFGAEYNIVQRTAVGAAPLLGKDIDYRPNAKRINQFVFDSIKRDMPDTVVLAANWSAYNWRGVEVTIRALRGAQIHRIVVVGPVPQWVGSLPQQLFYDFERHHSKILPIRMTTGINKDTLLVDALMGPFCQQLGAMYISPCTILRNENGFLVRLGDTADSLVCFDYGHLTKAGSEYLVSRFQSELR
jgi:peptidoglycan/LPS O-acetylase OafA/YrhL